MRTILMAIMLVPCHVFALTILPPQIEATNTVDGATTLAGVHCFVSEGRNAGTVDGVLVVKTDLLGLGVNLAVWDQAGPLVASWSVASEKKGALSVFWFTLKRDFLENAMITVFAKDDMYEFRLKTVPIKGRRTDLENAVDQFVKQNEERPTTGGTILR